MHVSIRGCGRTDFQHGSAQAIDSVHMQIFTLPDVPVSGHVTVASR
jgi:hypothetical protein